MSRLVGIDADHVEAGDDRFEAFLFNLVVVGTTFGKISKPVQALSQDIPWRDVIDTRNRIVHAYWQMDPALLSTVTAGRLGRLLAAVDGLIDLMVRETS